MNEWDPEQRVWSVWVGCESPNFKNTRKHWRVVANSIQAQRIGAMHALAHLDVSDVERALGGTPNHVHFCRIGPGTLDCDSVPTSVAAVRDQFCAWLAHDNTPLGKGDDGPRCGIKFTYSQEQWRAKGVRIEIRRVT